MKSMYYWLGKHVHAPYGTWIFGLLVFIEGFFIVPVSTLLTFYCLENRKNAFLYAAIASIMSVFAALAGYFLGYLLWQGIGQNIIYYLITPDKFEKGVLYYKKYQALAILVGTVTPMPFKALTLTAGFCGLPILPFLFFSLLGRGTKFFAIAGAIYKWGNHVQYYIDTYFYYLVALFILSMITLWKITH